MAQQEYDYYGFISYNRHDRKEAVRLQQQLERYKLPKSLRKEFPDLPERVSPIFLDQSDLVAHDEGLEQALLDQLDRSAYLIVLCSPNSAHSPWVNAEIEHFIGTGRTNHIIPVIISGESHAKDPANECYPPALRDLGGNDKLLSIRIENHGRNGILLRLIATILHLRLDDLIARDAAYRRRKNVIISLAAAVMAAVLAAVIWYITPHSVYYREVVSRWEVPAGIGRVSGEERKSLPFTYRLTTLRNRVISMERVNSAGIPVDGYSFSESGITPIIRYVYENNGTLSRTEYYDAFEQPLYTVNYSADLRILDFVQSGSGYSYSLPSETNIPQQRPESSVTENHNDIIRYVQDYDENGLMTQRLFKRDNRGSSGGTPVRNGDGIWGESYTYDSEGRALSVCGIDREGQIMAASDGIACRTFTYDEKGRQISRALTDIDGKIAEQSGAAVVSCTYDSLGRAVRIDHSDAEGRLFSRTAASITYEYDEHGFVTNIRYYDSIQAPYYSNGYAGIRFVNDPQGRPLSMQFLDAEGLPVSSAAGYAQIVFIYDNDGRTAEYHYLDRNGLPAINTEIRASGIRNTWEGGFLSRIDYLDSEGKRTVGNNGFASIRYAYNSDRQLEKEWYLDTEDDPVRCGSGFAAQVFTYTDGNVTEWAYQDENGEPCTDSMGTAFTVYTYEGGLRTSTEYFGSDREPVLRFGYYHRETAEYDDFGQPVKLAWFGTEGESVNNEENYSSVLYTYDNAGRIETETFHDINDMETTIRAQYDASCLHYEYDKLGNIVRVLYRSELARPNDLVSECISEYDDRGNLTESRWLNSSGEPVQNANGYTKVQTFYDELGLVTERRFYSDESDTYDSERYTRDALGRQTAAEISEFGFTVTIRSFYDEPGNLTAQQYEDENGELISPGTAWARVEYRYDAFGNQTDIRWIGTDGKPVMAEGKGAHYVMAYDGFGRCVSTEYYDTEDRPTDAGGYFRWTRTYNAYGWPAEEKRYDTEGRYLGRIVWTYTPAGMIEKVRHYDMNGEEIREYLRIPVITDVMQDNPAAEAGISAGDILMRYGDWTFDQVLSDPENWQTELQSEVAKGRENEKRIAVLYTAGEGREANGPVPGFGSIDVSFQPGLVGIEIGSIEIPAETYRFLSDIFQQHPAADIQ